MTFFIRIISVGSLLLLTTLHSTGQSIGIVKDSATQEPIPFVNIWIEGESIGTTANEKGEFRFQNTLVGKTIVLSSIGYEPKKIIIKNNGQTILLKPAITQLKEVVIKNNRNSKTNTLGEKFKTSAVRLFFICDGQPYMKAKYFPYHTELEKTPYVSTLELVTTSPIDNATFNLRFYTMNAEGRPEKPIYNENIIVSVKKGRNLTSVDLLDKMIEIPTTGILVAAEFLVVKQNQYTFTYTKPSDTVKVSNLIYVPGFGTVPVEMGNTNWVYKDGAWTNPSVTDGIQQQEYNGKYSELAIKLTLSN